MTTATLPKMKEKEFTAQVIQLAQLRRWKVAHFRPLMNRKGEWRTAVQGDGKGFPDLVLVRGPRLIVAELKCGSNKPSPEQQEWLLAFGAIPSALAFTWYPKDWDRIVEILE